MDACRPNAGLMLSACLCCVPTIMDLCRQAPDLPPTAPTAGVAICSRSIALLFMLSARRALLSTASSADFATSTCRISSVPSATMINAWAISPAFTSCSPFLTCRFLANLAISEAFPLASATKALRFAFVQMHLLMNSISSGRSRAAGLFGVASEEPASAAMPSIAGLRGKVKFLCSPSFSNSLRVKDRVTSCSGPAAQIVATIGKCETSDRAPK
mmetsp:Transcript_23772/g.66378  ORF Transcript_23772/g.66378 Transcript_23772/m.66378 type:complete len:215 (+) Transcript_23772:2026-2670(+)